ncbi:hypothetical protein HanPI659440_Chr12g0449041 [Helianthus annuus]|nr:hypothetical protein HanPI659440_Chr12g0449041 [Helianthus annuus]
MKSSRFSSSRRQMFMTSDVSRMERRCWLKCVKNFLVDPSMIRSVRLVGYRTKFVLEYAP